MGCVQSSGVRIAVATAIAADAAVTNVVAAAVRRFLRWRWNHLQRLAAGRGLG